MVSKTWVVTVETDDAKIGTDDVFDAMDKAMHTLSEYVDNVTSGEASWSITTSETGLIVDDLSYDYKPEPPEGENA